MNTKKKKKKGDIVTIELSPYILEQGVVEEVMLCGYVLLESGSSGWPL